MDDVSLKEYIDRIFNERDKAARLAFKSQQDALLVGRGRIDRQWQALNDLRNEFNLARRDLVTRMEYTSTLKTMEDKISVMEKYQEKETGKGVGISFIWQLAISLITACAASAVIFNFFRH